MRERVPIGAPRGVRVSARVPPRRSGDSRSGSSNSDSRSASSDDGSNANDGSRDDSSNADDGANDGSNANEYPYAVLGVPQDAAPQAVRDAYKRRVRETHPDKGGDTESFRKIDQVYKELAKDFPQVDIRKRGLEEPSLRPACTRQRTAGPIGARRRAVSSGPASGGSHPALPRGNTVDTASPPVVARRTHREYGVIVYRCSRYAIIQPDNPRGAEDTLLALRGEFESWTAPPRQTCVTYVRESGGTRRDLAKQLQLQGDPPRAAHAMLVQEMPSESRGALQRVFAALPRQGEHVCAVRRKWEALVGPVDVQGYDYSTLSALLQDHGASIWRVASGTYCCWRKSDGAHSLSPPTTSD